jgi:hypothetical protein
MFAVVFNGKVETEKLDELITGFQKLLSDTDSEFFGRIENYELARYVDYQKIDESSTEKSDDKTERN